MNHPVIADVRSWIERTASLPANQDRAEVRILATLVTAGFLISLAEPLVYLFLVPASLVSKVAALAPSIYCVAAAFLLCFLATVPHLFALMFQPSKLHVAWPRKAAAGGAVGAAIVWLYLATLALPLDVGAVEWAYLTRTVGSLLVGGTYGVSLNAQQLRECLHAKD